MIDTVLFDMGGTLEDIYVDDASKEASAREVLRILKEKGFSVSMDVPEAMQELAEGWVLNGRFGLDFETVKPFAEELAHMWEVTYYHRSLRPGVKEMLEGLKGLGMKLGVVSNTASMYQVFWILKEYGIRDYFQDVTLSSVTGYRKPDPNIFLVSLKQVQSDPSTCAYVGDTFSRDVIGPQRLGFGATFHIHSHLTASRDKDVPDSVKATYSISEICEVYTILKAQTSVK